MLKKTIGILLVMILTINYFSFTVFATDDPSEIDDKTNVSSESNESSSTETSDSINIDDSRDLTNQNENESALSDPVQPIKEIASPSLSTFALNDEDDGTENKPYRVGTIADLKTALSKNPASGSTLYIKLINDIQYSDSEKVVSFNKDTILDGDDHYLLYTGANYDASHFVTSSNNLNITFKNIKYGNSIYPNSTWYGILCIRNSNVNFTVENIDYNISKGGQPFYAYQASNNTLTVKGVNNFNSNGYGYGGEFSEGFGTINFAEDSKTTIYNDTTDATAVFWSNNGQEINIQKNAVLDIIASKSYLSYGSLFVNAYENSQVLVKFVKGVNYTDSRAAIASSGAANLNMNNNSIGRFRTEKNAFSIVSPTITANSPKYVLFENSSNTTGVLSLINQIKFTSNPTADEQYEINYLDSTGQNNLARNVTGNTTVTNTNINSGYSLLFNRSPRITDFSALAAVGTNMSDINTQINQWTPDNLLTDKVYYKFSKSKLYSDADINSENAQMNIENATTDVIKTIEIPITDDISANSKASLKDLAPQNYYVYAKFDPQQLGDYRINVPWVEQVVTINPYIEVSLPDKFIFTSSRIGSFGKAQNAEEYSIRNSGNVPINFSIKSLTVNSGSSPVISLLDQLTGGNQELSLRLIAKNTSTDTTTTLGSLVEGTLNTSSKIKLTPYWDSTENNHALYLNGEYSGPLIGTQNVNYSLKFGIESSD